MQVPTPNRSTTVRCYYLFLDTALLSSLQKWKRIIPRYMSLSFQRCRRSVEYRVQIWLLTFHFLLQASPAAFPASRYTYPEFSLFSRLVHPLVTHLPGFGLAASPLLALLRRRASGPNAYVSWAPGGAGLVRLQVRAVVGLSAGMELRLAY